MPELYARLLRVYTDGTSMTRLSDIVHSDPDILGGTPVFVGTRVPIQSLFDYLEGGETLDEFLRQFPSVRRDQAIAALDLVRATLLASARSSRRAAAARPCRCAPRPPCRYRGRPWLDGHHERRASAAHGRRVRRAGPDGPGHRVPAPSAARASNPRRSSGAQAWSIPPHRRITLAVTRRRASNASPSVGCTARLSV